MGLTHWGLVMLWWHRYNNISMSTLAQVMTCCLTAPSHYPYQCWFIISGIKWRSSEGNFIWIAEKSNSFSEFENYLLKIIPISPRDQRVKSKQKSWALNTPLKVCIVCMIYQHILERDTAGVLTHWGLVTHICVMKKCSHFPSDAYMRQNYSISL